MFRTLKQDAKQSKVIDDVDFQQQEAEEFRALLNHREQESAPGSVASMIAGQVLKGKIVAISKDHVIVDVGLKSEGLLPISEFSDLSELVLGHEVEVLLDQAEGDNGQIILSREKAGRVRQWEYICHHCEEGSIIKGKVIRKVKGGLMVDVGMEAFLPGSQIDNKRIKSLDEYLGETFDFEILKIDKERKNIVLSRRELLEKERISKKIALLETIHPGEIRTGIVKNITDFGVFLDMEGVDGLLHITDMSWKRVRHPEETVRLGQTLEVVILSVDKEKGRVALGMKQRESNPWEKLGDIFQPGTLVRGRIVNLVSYGAFIELKTGIPELPDIEGLIHVSEMSWTRPVMDPKEVVQKGDEVDAIVLSVQKEEGKISLGIKQTEKNPWDDIEARYPIGSHVEAQVRNITNYGAFVELAPGIDALIHISNLNWTQKITHPSEILTKGDIVNVVILSIDKASKKITLGLQQSGVNPWEEIERTLSVGSIVHGVVTKTTAFGAFVELANGVEALVHVSELCHAPFGKVEDVVSRGQEVTARVIKIEPKHRKIELSIKEYMMDPGQSSQDDIVIGGQESSRAKKERKSRSAKNA